MMKGWRGTDVSRIFRHTVSDPLLESLEVLMEESLVFQEHLCWNRCWSATLDEGGFSASAMSNMGKFEAQ